MAVIIHSNGGGGFGGLFPSDYTKMKSTALGDTFPGWEADIIPICISLYANQANLRIEFGSGQNTMSKQISASQTLNSKKIATLDSNSWGSYSASAGPHRVTASWVRANAYSVFIPFFYDFDFDAIKAAKSTIQGMATACTVWLER